MNTLQEIVLTLLRAAIGVETVSTSPALQQALTAEQWQEVNYLCAIHGIGPLVYDQLLSLPTTHPLRASLPAPIQQQMKMQCMHNMLLQEQWEPMIIQAFDALHNAGIHAILLKGFGLANRYPKPYLRSFGDADIWVGIAQYHQACGVLRNTFPEAIHHDEEWDELKHYCFVFPDSKAIELHRVAMDFTNSNDEAAWQAYEVSELTDGQPMTMGNEVIPIPNERFDSLFVFLHAWEHFCGGGMPIKQLVDIALLPPTTDRALLRRLHLLQPYEMVQEIVQKRILSADGSVLSQASERLWQQILKEGQARVQDYDGAKDKYEARDKAKQMPIIARKMKTLRSRWEAYRFLRQFAPSYAGHVLVANVMKGVRRTVRGERMIDY